MNKVFMVVGPQSSGTNMMQEILRQAGCAVHKDGLPMQRCDLVWRTSIPEAGSFPLLVSQQLKWRREGYKVVPLIMTRDWNAIVQSQIKRAYVNSREIAEGEIREAYRFAFTQCSGFIAVSYESFCTSREFRKWLFEERLGLPLVEDFQIYYANGQYYE